MLAWDQLLYAMRQIFGILFHTHQSFCKKWQPFINNFLFKKIYFKKNQGKTKSLQCSQNKAIAIKTLHTLKNGLFCNYLETLEKMGVLFTLKRVHYSIKIGKMCALMSHIPAKSLVEYVGTFGQVFGFIKTDNTA